jgi:hypothetical protein
MKKWAGYLISEVTYDSKNLISVATRHQDTDQGVTKGEPIDRLKIASDIKNGLSYITIYNGKNSWKKGHTIQTFSIEDDLYLRIDKNKVKLDYLGDLPESSFKKLSPIPEPETAQLSHPRGLLPKEYVEEIPQELELIPEPENLSEEFIQLNNLQQQIDELKNMISDQLLSKPQFEEECDTNKFFKIEELVKDVERSEENEVEHRIIQTLRKQNKKLDDIEKKLYDSKKTK